jgi:methionine-gamma-lyase
MAWPSRAGRRVRAPLALGADHIVHSATKYLGGHAKVDVCHFPGLASFPQIELARRQMKLPGGMVAFELKGGIDSGHRFMNALQVITRAVSLGEGLVRISLGLEDPEGLLDDVRQALDAA